MIEAILEKLDKGIMPTYQELRAMIKYPMETIKDCRNIGKDKYCRSIVALGHRAFAIEYEADFGMGEFDFYTMPYEVEMYEEVVTLVKWVPKKKMKESAEHDEHFE